MKLLKNKVWRYVLLAMLCTGFFIQYQYRAPKRNFSDFHVPYTVGQKILKGEKIYTYDDDLSYFKYPPFYATLMTPLSVLPERWAASLWYIMNLFFIMVLFHCSKQLIIREREGFEPFLLYALTFWVMVRFLLQNMHEGQANIFMLTLLTLGLYFYRQRRLKLSAFFIAFSVMTKYMPVVFLPYFLLIGEFTFLIYVGTFILFFNFFPALGLGFNRAVSLIYEQLNFLFDSSLDYASLTNHANQSLISFIVRFSWEECLSPSRFLSFDRATVFRIFYVLAAVIYCMAVAWAWRRRGEQKTAESQWGRSIDFGLLFMCMALFNPNAWMNFFVALVFPYMLVLYYLIKCRAKDKLILILFILSFALCSWTSEEVVNWFAGDNFEFWSSVTFGTFILFAALFILKLRSLKTESNLK